MLVVPRFLAVDRQSILLQGPPAKPAATISGDVVTCRVAGEPHQRIFSGASMTNRETLGTSCPSTIGNGRVHAGARRVKPLFSGDDVTLGSPGRCKGWRRKGAMGVLLRTTETGSPWLRRSTVVTPDLATSWGAPPGKVAGSRIK
jgi:hypothetical protein